ncbi:MAG: replication initiator protein [Microviridae sp.]|nr:MAG: replication initiator protein [Microviridae sp.]
MSLKPGLGAGWFEKYHSDVYPRDEVVLRGRPMRPPTFYDTLYECNIPDGEHYLHMVVKPLRIENARKSLDNNTPERLAVREAVQIASISQLVKTL